MEPNIEIQDNLKTENISHYPLSFYKNLNIPPIGVSQVAMNANTNTQITFQIPGSNVYNFSKTYLSFDVPDIINTNVASAAYNINLFNSFVPWFSRIEVYTSNNNTYLVNVSNLDVVNKMISQLELNYRYRNKSMDSHMYQSYRSYSVQGNVAGNVSTTQITPCGPIDNTYSIQTDTSLYVPAAVLTTENQLDLIGNINSPSQYLNGANVANGAISIKGFKVNILLSDLLPNSSFFSIDKDLPSSNVVFVRLTFNNIDSLGFACTSDDLGLATAQYKPLSYVTSFNISNISLTVYNQANPKIVEMVMAEYQQQQELVLPQINVQQVTKSGTNPNTSYKITSIAPQSRVYKSYHSIFAPNNLSPNNAGKLLRYNDNATPGTKENTAAAPDDLLTPVTKYTDITLYIDGNIYFVFSTARNDFYRYISETFHDHSYPSLYDWNSNPVIAFCYDTEKSKPNKYDCHEYKGLMLNNSDLMINHNVSGCALPSSISYDVVTLLCPLYIKNGIFQLSPF